METTSFEQIKAILHSIDKVLKDGLAGVRTLAVGAQKTADEAKEKASTVDDKMDANNPVGTGSFSMGRRPGSNVGEKSHTEGHYTSATKQFAHAEGSDTLADGRSAHAEGEYTEALGICCHAEGSGTKAEMSHSHAEGRYSVAGGSCSHAEGLETHAVGEAQHVQGRLNIANARYAHVVGNGEYGEGGTPVRSNAHTLDWDGVAWFAGGVKVGGTYQDNAMDVMVNGDSSITLSSSNGTKYKLTVADDGTLTTAKA